MDNKKFEKLIDLIINENEEQARELFHEIVVEKSREIYENIMDEEMMGGNQMVGEVGDLMDEISAEEAGGMVEADEEGMDDLEDEGPIGDEEVVDIESGDLEGEGGMEEIEDAVVRIEDKLDQLMAEFEELMSDEEGEEDFGDEEGEEEAGEEDFGDEEGEEEAGEEGEEVMEAIQLKQIGGKTYNTFGQMGDNGQNSKSIALKDPKVKVPGVNPVNFAGTAESVPTGPKNPSNSYTKGETQVKHAGQFKNAPAQGSQDLEKAPAPKHGDDGSNTKSPLGESRKVVKKKIVR